MGTKNWVILNSEAEDVEVMTCSVGVENVEFRDEGLNI
jgi:hypothetical protein